MIVALRRLAAPALGASLYVGTFLATGQALAQETPPQPPPDAARQEPPAPPAAESPHAQAIAFYQRGMAAYRRKDYLDYLENLQKAVQLDPDQPTMRYRLACASALVGNHADVFTLLDRLVALKSYHDLADNPDFDAMRQLPEFQRIAAAMRGLKNPINHGVPAFHLLEKDLITEGIAHDPVSGDFFIGSVHKRKIVRANKRGKSADFTAPRQDGLGAVLGLKVDPARRILWACSTGMAQMEGATEEEKGRAALYRYDLGTGAFAGKYPLAGGAAGHNCNDLAVASSGEVFVSDSESGEVFSLAPGAGDFRVVVEAGRLRSPQGLALTPDGKALVVADYASSLYRVDLATRELSPLAGPDNLALLGVDGLIGWPGGLVVIQNGINPHRVVRLETTPGYDRILGAEILEMNNPLFDEPTLGTLVGNLLYFVANSQWGRFTSDGAIYPMNRLAEPVIMKVKVD